MFPYFRKLPIEMSGLNREDMLIQYSSYSLGLNLKKMEAEKLQTAGNLPKKAPLV